jgi:hypothetical protein
MSERPTPVWLDRQAQLSLDRLLPVLGERYAPQDPAGWPVFEGRLRANFRRLWLARPADLRAEEGE